MSRVTKCESEKYIERLLLVSISCVTYLRNLFDDSHYENSSLELRVNNDQAKLPIKLLKSGISEEADTVLLWIHNYSMDLIHNNRLKAICFSIFTDKKCPQKSLETYVFYLSYKPRINQWMNLSDDPLITLNLMNRQLFNIIKHLIAQTQLLADLPPRRYLSVDILLNESVCPRDYVPEGFRKCATFNYHSHMEDINCGKLVTIHHEVVFKISSLCSEIHRDKSHLLPFGINFSLPFPPKKLDLTVKQVIQQNLLNIGDSDKNNVVCMCGSEKSLEYTGLIVCCKCRRSVHRICECWFNVDEQTGFFKCENCLNQNEILPRKWLMNARKIIAFVESFRHCGFKSFTRLTDILGLSITNKSDINCVANSFSMLIQDGIIVLTKARLHSERVFILDILGIIGKKGPLPTGKYYIKFRWNNKLLKEYIDPIYARQILGRFQKC